MSSGREIRLVEEDDWWVATDVETGVTSQGETRETALENLDDAVVLYYGGGREPTDAELREAGIDPETNRQNRDGPQELPDVLK